jgi:transcriptional antiterminator/mannitol/fructose-specific phosphotransferase system IIA component
MELSKRQIFVLRYLADCPNADEWRLAKQLGVTSQTLHAELEGMRPMLIDYGIDIESETGKLRVNGSEHLSRLLVDMHCFIEMPFDQQVNLLFALNYTWLTLQDIADALYVSKSSVEKKISMLRRTKACHICSERHKGLLYSGSEFERQTQFVRILMPYVVGINYLEDVSLLDRQIFPILNYVSLKEVSRAETFVSEILSDETGAALVDESVHQLFLYVLAGIRAHRLGHGNDIVIPDLHLTNQQESRLIDFCKLIARAGDVAGIDFGQPEKNFLAGLLVSLRKLRMPQNASMVTEMGGFVQSMLSQIQNRYSIDLTGDQQFCEDLAFHLYTTVIRKDQFDLPSDDFSRDEIKRQYPLGFDMATTAASIIESSYGYIPTESELVYLALHFQVALERLSSVNRRMRVVVVCHYGLAAASLITERIRQAFAALDVVGVYSVWDFLSSNIDCDLILSTERLPATDTPVIYVTPAMRSSELSNIRDFVEGQATSSMLTAEIQQAIIVDVSFCTSKEQVIKLLAERLSEAGCVEDGYGATALSRERVSPTNLTHLAIPHGSPKLVRATRLAIGRAKPPISWNDTLVSCVPMFACSQDLLTENPTVFSTFYRRLASIDIEERIDELSGLDDVSFLRRFTKIITTTSKL